MAENNQKPDKNSENGFFDQNDYQQNVGLVTFGLKNPINKKLTTKDIEDLNTLAPLSFIQHKFRNDKDYQLTNRYDSLEEETNQLDNSEENDTPDTPQLPGIEPISETTEEENDNLDYDMPEPDDQAAILDNDVPEQQEDLKSIGGIPEKAADRIDTGDNNDNQGTILDSDEISALADEDGFNDLSEANSKNVVENSNTEDDSSTTLEPDELNKLNSALDEDTKKNIENTDPESNNILVTNNEDSTDQISTTPNSDELNDLSDNLSDDYTGSVASNDTSFEEDQSKKSTSEETKITLSSDELNAIINTDGSDKDAIDNTVEDPVEPIEFKKDLFDHEEILPATEDGDPIPTEGTADSNVESDDVDEQSLYSSFDQSLDSSVDKKYKKQLLEKKLASYKPENRTLILQSIQHHKISEDQINGLIDLVLKNASETLVVETLNQQLFKKTGYEIFERRDQERKQETHSLEENYSSYRKKRLLAGLTVISTFTLFLVLSVYFSYESILTYRLYQKAIAAAEEEQYQDAELFFDEAYQLQPQISPSKELAEVYLKKNQLELAKDKYDQLFLSFPNSSEVLVANSRFYRIINDFNRAKALVTLGERRFPQDLLLLQEKAEILLEEGFTFKDYTQAQKNWLAAEKMFSDLLAKDPDNQGLFLQRKLELAAIQKDFLKSRNYYSLLQGLNTTYDLRSMSRYLAFLIETQEHIGDNFYQIKPQLLSGIQNVFAISAIDQIIMQLEAIYPNHYLVNIEKARWAQHKNSFNEARQLIDTSIDAIRQKQNFLINEDLVYALNTAGMINIRQEEVIPALEYFQQSLTVAPNNYLANYYVGKINLTSLNQVKKSKEFFTLSYENWFNPNDRRYLDTRYSLGYINFLEGKAETNPKNQELYFKNSIEHWSELLRNKLPEKSYLVVFNLATTYLYLKEYELAQIFFESNLEELKPIFRYYQDHSDQLIRGATVQKNELALLSDVFNNLAVAQINAQTEIITPGTEIPGVAIEHLINAITLKDQLGVLKGVPYGNFNTINDYPKYSANFAAKRPLRIGDSFIPNSMFEKIF